MSQMSSDSEPDSLLGVVTPVEPSYPSWCYTDPTHRGFTTDGTGMLLCAECGGGCETDYNPEGES
jgi:hypothetical protein